MMLPALALLAPLAAVGPVQQLEVVADATTVTPLTWDRACGDLPKMARFPKGTRMQLRERGDEWRVLIGGQPVFGTDICGGLNPTLQPVTQRREGQEWFLACKSRRVVKGTETTEAYLRRKTKGWVEIDAQLERFTRRGAQSCKVLLERQTVLRPFVEEDEERPVAAKPGPGGPVGQAVPPDDAAASAKVPAPQKAPGPPVGKKAGGALPDVPPRPLSAGEQAQIESEITNAMRKAADRADMAPLEIVHQNRMSDELRIVERHYILDGKALGEEEGAAWGGLKPGGLSQVHDDVAQVGVHVLELKLVLQTDDGSRLRVKDAVFFDVTAEEPVRVRVISREEGGFFTPTTEKPKIRFELNGQPAS